MTYPRTTCRPIFARFNSKYVCSLLTQTINALSQGFRPCSLQKPEHVRSFLQALDQKGHVKPDARILAGEPGLTKGERLQLVNHAPASIVELHTLIEELGQRMSDDQIADILDCVVTHLPIPDTSATAMSVPATTAPMPENTEGVQDIVMDEAEIEAAQDAFPEDEFEHEDPNAGASAQDDDDD